MKIGVYGGSFNPIHLMHEEIVKNVLDRGYVDRVIILPTGNYYKKSNLLKGEERIRMLSLAFKDDNRVIICDYEFKNNLICTYRSLDYLHNIYKEDELYFIMGADNLLSFSTWKNYEYILDNYNLLIIDRNVDYRKELELFNKYKGEIIVAKDIVTTNISSSFIRENLYKNNNIDYTKYLDKNVYEYLKDKGFYKKGYKEITIQADITNDDFLKNYDSNNYEKISLTTDIVLFSVSDIEKNNYREVDNKVFSVLLVKRNTHPYLGKWTLPGGFVSLDETLLECAKRVLFTETNLDNIYLEQLYTFDAIDRDPRTRVLSCSYMGLVDKNRLTSELNVNASFFNITTKRDDNYISIEFYNNVDNFTCIVEEIYDDYGVKSYKEINNDYLAFDHLLAIVTSIDRLKNKIEYSDIVFHIMPKYFTLKELQLVYEAILDKKLIDPVFRREISSKVKKTNKTKKDGGHRPSSLYQYKNINFKL